MKQNSKDANPIWNTLLGGLKFSIEFLKNPVVIMKAIPDIPMQEVFLVQTAIAAATGLAMGLVAQSFFQIFWGIFLYPIVCVVATAISSLILYYTSSYLLKREFKFSQFYILVFLASIPEYIIRILSPILESIDILGLGISCALIRMGLIYSYKIERQKATQIVGLLFVVILLSFFARWFQEYNFSTNFYSN